MQRFTTTHLTPLKRILRRLKGTIFMAFFFGNRILLHSLHIRILIGLIIKMTTHLLTLSTRVPTSSCGNHRRAVARSSTKAKYKALAIIASWINSLLTELGLSSSTFSILWDNLSALYLTHNSVYHTHMKHISIDIHFVQQLVQQGKLKVKHVNTIDQ